MALQILDPLLKGLAIRGQIDKQNEFNRQAEIAKQQDFMNLDKNRQGALFQDASAVNTFLKAGQTNKALGVLSDRMNFIEQFGGDPRDTKEIADLILANDIQGATTLLDSVVDVGIKNKFLDDPRLLESKISKNNGVSTETNTFNDLIKKAGLNKSDTERAARIKLRLDAGAVGSSAQTISQNDQLTKDVATSQAAIESAKETGKLESKFKLQPKVSKAVQLAIGEANLVGAQNKEERSNSKALKVYDIAFKTLADALGKTTTGPIAGLMPALTSSAQSAQGAISMVLPTMKSVFRESGEGTFTEGDQKLLTDMVPTRSDNPATIKFKLNAIDSIIRAKLGTQKAPQQETQQPATLTSSGGIQFTVSGG